MKWFNKWLRRIHRWIAIPTALTIPIAVVVKFSGGELLAGFPALENGQSIFMLALAITGSYLFLLPYIVKWQRRQRRREN